MKGEAVSGLLLTLLLFGMLPFVINIQPVRAVGTIYIRADGSIDPPTANITTLDNVTYTLTGNINESIAVQRNNIVIDGAGYTLQGTGSGTGIDLSRRSNVTIKNATIKHFSIGIEIYKSSYNTVSGNNITNNGDSVNLIESSYNTVSGNNITNNNWSIEVFYDLSSNNTIYHNAFVDNTHQMPRGGYTLNVWDTGYPSGGNYWSDYAGVDVKSGPNQDVTGSDGIGDTPYVIDANNRDKYPLMEPYPFAEPYPWEPHDVAITSVATLDSKTVFGQDSIPSVNVIVFNYGNSTEAFNVTVYANTTMIGTREITLSSRSATIITLATTGFAKGNYTLSANATTVPEETDTSDNTCTEGWVLVTIAGDVDGNHIIDVIDQRLVQLAMFAQPGQSNWNANMDIDDNQRVDVIDQRIQQLHMFEPW